MRTLDEIALATGTDKASNAHRYTKVYSSLFEPIRFGVKNVCEVGIQYGYSLKMWGHYFTNAKVVGVDIDKECLNRVNQSDKMRVIIESASAPKILELLKPEAPEGFDIIIDDGSHHTDDQIKTFELLFPLVKDGGYYIIEDIYPAYFGDAFYKFLKEKIDNVFYWDTKSNVGYGFADDANYYDRNITNITFHRFLVIIQKGDNTRSLC